MYNHMLNDSPINPVPRKDLTMHCERCLRPSSPRVYEAGKDQFGNLIKIDESGVGGRQVVTGECNRRSVTGLIKCMELELARLRPLEEQRTKDCEQILTLKKTIQDYDKQGRELEDEVKRLQKVLYDEKHSYGIQVERLKYLVIRIFGKYNWFDLQERCLRLVEEVIELAQVMNINPGIINRILERVMLRPVGDLRNEISGVALTLHALAAVVQVDIPTVCEEALKSIESKDPEFFRNKQKSKFHDGIGMMPSPPFDL